MESDSLDHASVLEEEDRLLAARRRKPVPLRTGCCISCGETLHSPDGIACDAECLSDHRRVQRAAFLQGRAADPTLAA